MTLLDTSLLPHGGSWFEPGLFMASLDHAMWFHRPFRADDWLLYAWTRRAPRAGGSSWGPVFTKEGTLGGHGHARGPDPGGAAVTAAPVRVLGSLAAVLLVGAGLGVRRGRRVRR